MAATQRRKPTGNQRAEPQGPLGHLIQDAIDKKRLGRPRTARLLNAAIKQETGQAAGITHSSIRNWISRWVIPRTDTQRAIIGVLDIPERTFAQAKEAQEAARAELHAQRSSYLHDPARTQDASSATSATPAQAIPSGDGLVPTAGAAEGNLPDEGFISIPIKTADGVIAYVITRRGFMATLATTMPALALPGHIAIDDFERLEMAGISSNSKHELELLRQSLSDAISDGGTSEASLIDWEQTVLNHGRATRDRSPIVMLSDLTADLVELRRAIACCRSFSTMRRLTQVMAQMAGLMCLELVKLDDRDGFRNWARTARIAAQEAGDLPTYSWVRAQEAYGHYYAGDLLQAIEVAQHAQALADSLPYVGAALAAALEARAHAALGNSNGTRAALDHAQAILAQLDPESLIPSAFGYTESQLRFHEGSALTHLRETEAAWKAQERALALCAPHDYTDRALTQLDRATCLAHDGDVSGAKTFAAQALTGLTSDQRRGIITLRAHDVIAALPARAAALPAAKDLRDLVMVATTDEDSEE